MENAPITALSYQNELLFARGNTLFFPVGKISLDSSILAIKFTNSRTLLVLKREIVILSENNCEIYSTFSFESNIADVHVSDEIVVFLHNGVLFNISRNSLKLISRKQVFNKTVITAKIEKETLFIGSFESVYQVSLNKEFSLLNSSFRMLNIHSGRIFNLCISENQVFSCGDDRSICLNGIPIIQEFRDYFFNLEFSNKKLYTFNRDGNFRIFQQISDLKYNLIYCRFFGIDSLQSMLIVENGVFIGTVGGSVYYIEDQVFKMVFGQSITSLSFKKINEIEGDCRLYSSGVLFQNGRIKHSGYELHVPRKPIDVAFSQDKFYILFNNHLVISNLTNNKVNQVNARLQDLVRDDFNVDLMAVANEQISRISAFQNLIYFYNENMTNVVCEKCLAVIKKIEIKKINIIKYGIIGTKDGCIYIENVYLKVSENSISDILLDQKLLYILDSEGIIYKCNDYTLINGFKDSHECAGRPFSNVNNLQVYFDDAFKTCVVTKKSLLSIDSLFLHRKYENSQGSIDLALARKFKHLLKSNKNSIFEIEISEEIDCSCKFANFTAVFQNLNPKILGTDHGEIFLLESNKIVDRISLIGSIVGIFKIEDSILIYTNSGFAYSISIDQNLFYIKNSIKIGEKICSSFNNKACLSSGEIIEFDSNLGIVNRIKTTNFISCLFEDLISFSGFVKYLDIDHVRIANRNIFKIVTGKINDRKIFVAAGDDQSVVMFDSELKILKKAVPHSAQIFDIAISELFIFTLSSDMKICAMNHNLEIIRYIDHNVRLPKILMLDSLSLTIYGESIQEIDITKKFN